MLNKDFLREIFLEKKSLLALNEVAWIKTPRYEELSVLSMFPKFKQDPRVMKYIPDRLPKGRLPDREYFYNILNTIYPEYTQELIREAGKNRFDAKKRSEDLGIVKVSEEWWRKLTSVPFTSCK